MTEPTAATRFLVLRSGSAPCAAPTVALARARACSSSLAPSSSVSRTQAASGCAVAVRLAAMPRTAN